MRNCCRLRQFLALLTGLCIFTTLAAQTATPNCDSWQQTLANKKGTVTALWDEIEPFIYTNKGGALNGVEYEIMESFKDWLLQTHGIALTVRWEPAGSFQDIFLRVKNSKCHGLFGWSYYSITPERQQQVQFSLPYMPDVNVLVTNNREPMYASAQEFTGRLREMKAYSQNGTTMAEDVLQLQKNFAPQLKVTNLRQDYDILTAVASDENGFGYVPLSVYIVALQKGIRVKRQNVLSSNRQGFAAVMPLQSDWKPVLDEFFSSPAFITRASSIVTKYLGSEVKELVFADSQGLPAAPVTSELLSLEKEIVTKRLMDTVQEAEQHRALRNVLAIACGSVIAIVVVLYSRYRTRQKLSAQLHRQKEQIEQMNQLLKLKVLQARMNPHFLFNSLNSIQYFIIGDDKKASLQYISRFSTFLRKVINLGDELSIKVNEEADLLQEYLWLEQCRFQDRFDYQVTVSPEARHALILPFLTHSVVESALYNGILNLTNDRKGKLLIEFGINEAELTVRITDNGVSKLKGLLSDAQKRLLHREESMFQKRIALYNSQSLRKIVSEMKEGDGGNGEDTVVSLRVPQPLFREA